MDLSRTYANVQLTIKSVSKKINNVVEKTELTKTVVVK
jgi:hypothetical protein